MRSWREKNSRRTSKKSNQDTQFANKRICTLQAAICTSPRVYKLNENIQGQTQMLKSKGKDYEDMYRCGNSSCHSSILDEPQPILNLAKLVKSAPIVQPKPKPKIVVRKTVREMKRERLFKEIESNKKTILMDKKDYEEAQLAKVEQYKSNSDNLYDGKARRWFCQRGKDKALDFTNEEIKTLRQCFMALDEDQGGSIGLEELEDPLIGLGLADNTEKVEEIILKVDDDGEIEFPEFLKIIKSPDQDQNSQMITNFFKQMSTGSLGDPNLDFNVVVSEIRRTHMVKAITESHTPQGIEGNRILNNVKKQLFQKGEIDSQGFGTAKFLQKKLKRKAKIMVQLQLYKQQLKL